MVTIYILRLENEKYYVDYGDLKIMDENSGIPKDIKRHIDGIGGEWTEKYKPTGMYKIYKNREKKDVNKYTKMMMCKYGIDNVRGGIYSLIKLEDRQKILLMRELRIIVGQEDWCCSICDKEYEEREELVEHEYYCKEKLNICYICNERGHYMSDCNSKSRGISY